mgnify:CR=1 FL=1
MDRIMDRPHHRPTQRIRGQIVMEMPLSRATQGTRLVPRGTSIQPACQSLTMHDVVDDIQTQMTDLSKAQKEEMDHNLEKLGE